MNQLRTTSVRGAPAVSQWEPTDPPNMSERAKDSDSFASTSSPMKSAGSARQAKLTSRAAPIPSNADPVSRAEEAVKNRPRPNRYASSTASPTKDTGAPAETNGMRSSARAAVTTPTTGPARKTQVVVVLNTEPFRKSLAMS